MKTENKLQFEDRVPRVLAELIGIQMEQLDVLTDISLASSGCPDIAIGWGQYIFLVELKTNASAGVIALAVRQMAARVGDLGKVIVPIIAVPHMTEVGRRICRESRVGWLDLSGNGEITAEGMHVRVEGHPNKFKKAGRPASLFAPKSSRLARWMLMHPGQPWTQRALSKQTGIEEGYLSRLVHRMEDQQYLIRNPDGTLGVRDPDLLLDAWREVYQFDRHGVVKGHIPARTSEMLLRDISGKLADRGVKYAASGLAGAWLIDHFAGFRLVTIFIHQSLPRQLLADMDWRDEERGANVWLVIPNDDGVFDGAVEREGVLCAHPVQVYLDLKGHPERAKEAAEHLRAESLNRSRNAG